MGDPVGSLFMLTRVFILFGTLALVNFVLIVLFIPDQQIFSVETYTNDGSTKEQIISLMYVKTCRYKAGKTYLKNRRPVKRVLIIHSCMH